ncbi:relaxase/mobilization nuclease domain-containing protein [Bacillus thuringiensis]|uniref:Relaxase/mobilization nuclease family protein n=1 Tax=Bacillus thuringiensis YBT-1518 TaxID=529122 RepID=A0A9W3KJ23_BACTU|nr:relaxase/mobilization nuclease domain-containing protein [Bacillus thuringiensis]EKS8367093.1 relaxase/mobilization nuclease domain-containing protein [Bacillus cereus]AHA75423.1 relaxase/mobilization nuclease family protein [Bacillus thuringiensis YBT-1518]EKS8372984.1 relaxase/mobilization nuclease domain-containing protein [Bacillus cereus]MBG9483246.1 relaxase [Bacillus thuringiensis]MBG9497233.1 relaxase [Bacillus thuringiensis]
MSIVKIQKIKNLNGFINYGMQEHKTNEELVTSFECSIETIERDFRSVLVDYNEKNNCNKNVSARMIIQSFDSDDNLTPEQVHQYGVEFADNYLKGNHQYTVITHIETDNLHNHIVFNDIDFNKLKMFDTKRANTLDRLREENDKISEKYGLSIIEEGRKRRKKYLAFNEYVARSKQKSFKGNLEEIIDKNISKSNAFNEFLSLMQKEGYEHKQGKYLSFMNPKSGKFMRTKTMGFNYLEPSIKYRIENKDYSPVQTSIINRKWIDKSQEKFKNNKGLQRWATKQNINYLNELSSKLYKLNVSITELEEIEANKEALIDSFEKQLLGIDNEIFRLNKMKGCFRTYKKSHPLIVAYKKAENKMAFKQERYHEFKEYDVAKRDMNYLKKNYGIIDESELHYKLSLLTKERNLLYGSLGKEKELEVNRQEQQRQQQCRKENER